MRTEGSPTRRALPFLLGCTLAGWVGATPVFAQNAPMPDVTPPPADSLEAAIMKDYDPDLGTVPYPAPLNYPFAAPGGLQVQHWKDLTQSELRPGSVDDVHYYVRRMEDEQYRRRRERMASLMSGQMNPNQPRFYRRTAESEYESDYYGAQGTTMQPGMMVGPMFGPTAMAAGGDFIYILRGGTLYQLRTADMSVAAQTTLPFPGTSGATGTTGATGNVTPGTGATTPSTGATGNATGENQNQANPAAPNNPNTNGNQATTGANQSNVNGSQSNSTDNRFYRRGQRNRRGQFAPGTIGMGPRMFGGAAITVSGDYVYVLQGDTLYQLRTSDLSLVSQKTVPFSALGTTPGTPGTAPSAPGATGTSGGTGTQTSP